MEPVVVAAAPPIGALELSFFGMHDHDPTSTGWPSAPVGAYRAWDAGVLWRDIETSPGSYDFTRLDDIVDTAEKHGAQTLIVLGQTPPFHAKKPEQESFYGPGAASPPKLSPWRAYVLATATRYAERDVAYQVWNEANVSGFWSGTPRQMARLTSEAADVLASAHPDALLVAPSMAQRLLGQRAWFGDFYAQAVAGTPVGDLVDVVALHLYPEASGTPESSMDLLTAARVRLKELGVDKPVWNTEVNFGITGEAVEPAPTDQQQGNVARTFLLNAANDVRRTYWYGWDQQQIVDTLLSSPDGQITPAGSAYATVAEWLLGSVVEACTPDAEGTYTCRLRRSDGHRSVHWNPSAPATLPASASRLSYQSADGSRHEVAGGQTVPVGPVPIMIESAD